MLTLDQQAQLAKLPREVVLTLKDYPSVAENYLDNKDLPPLSQNHECRLLEFYYDCAELPILTIENGVLSSHPAAAVIPTIIEVMDETSFVFIQVKGTVILNRLGGHLPQVTSILVEL